MKTMVQRERLYFRFSSTTCVALGKAPCVDPETLGIRLWLLNNGNCTRSSDSRHQLLLVRSCRRAW
jgi:hypothetical protein